MVIIRWCYTFTWNPPRTQFSVSISFNNILPNVCFSHLSNKHDDIEGQLLYIHSEAPQHIFSSALPTALMLLTLFFLCMCLSLPKGSPSSAQVLSSFVAQGVIWLVKRALPLHVRTKRSDWRMCRFAVYYCNIPPWSAAVWGSSWAPWPPYSPGNTRWFPEPGEETQTWGERGVNLKNAHNK